MRCVEQAESGVWAAGPSGSPELLHRVTDWDADGDLDILIGAASKTAGKQRLYFVPNVVDRKRFSADQPVVIVALGEIKPQPLADATQPHACSK